MNLQQLDYIIAIDREKHFTKAAEKCFVTQATLSMMVKKLEEELDVIIFDRSKQPVITTKEGAEIIERAKRIVAEASTMKVFARELKGEMSGDLRLGIIPTLAPYLLPLFLKSFSEKIPELKIKIRELITTDIIRQLKNGELDIGLLATPLSQVELEEHPIFYEEFKAYASKSENLPHKKYLLPKHINPHHLWILEEGHCMRNQLINLCSLKKADDENQSLFYEAGSIETLINLVDKSEGITVIPQLAAMQLNTVQKKKLREFEPPKPVREISLVVNANFHRKKLLVSLKNEIIHSLNKNVPLQGKGLKVVRI